MTNEHEKAGWSPPMPPWTTVAGTGATRRVGVEIEMIGAGAEEFGGVVVDTLGGTAKVVSRHEVVIEGDPAGAWKVELDWGYLRKREAERHEPSTWIEELVDELLNAGADAVVPVEVVGPPLPLPRLADAERVVRALREHGALGTTAGVTHALGLQLNPEVPSDDVETLLRFLRAFLCLQDWLVRECDVDWLRRLTRYAAPFPGSYVRKVISSDYAPDLAGLIDDYVEENPTRNRALDLLPLFCELDEDRVRSAVDDPRVKPRPTFHYRLPNSEVDDPAWGLHVPWSGWLQVERLAADEPRLMEVCDHYARHLGQPGTRLLGDWARDIERWLTPTPRPESE